MSDSDRIVCTTPSAFYKACEEHGVKAVIPFAGSVVTGFRKVKIEFQPPAPPAPDPDRVPFLAWLDRMGYGRGIGGIYSEMALRSAWTSGRKHGEASAMLPKATTADPREIFEEWLRFSGIPIGSMFVVRGLMTPRRMPGSGVYEDKLAEHLWKAFSEGRKFQDLCAAGSRATARLVVNEVDRPEEPIFISFASAPKPGPAQAYEDAAHMAEKQAAVLNPMDQSNWAAGYRCACKVAAENLRRKARTP